MLHFVHRYTREVKVTSATNNYILSNIANVTNYPLNLYLLINNPIVSHYTDLPAFNVGSSFSEGAWIYIDNNSSIIGKSGNNGIGGEGG
ncbi:MAG: hypothetical protein ACKN9V_02815, partial [Pseudomonadota bacterium]